MLEIPSKEPTVRSALSQLLSQPERGELKNLILEGETSDPRSTTLILVSGREIATLAGLDTKLTENDELSLLPIAHGG
jgi:molybdopterin converting factor small subunit